MYRTYKHRDIDSLWIEGHVSESFWVPGSRRYDFLFWSRRYTYDARKYPDIRSGGGCFRCFTFLFLDMKRVMHFCLVSSYFLSFLSLSLLLPLFLSLSHSDRIFEATVSLQVQEQEIGREIVWELWSWVHCSLCKDRLLFGWTVCGRSNESSAFRFLPSPSFLHLFIFVCSGRTIWVKRVQGNSKRSRFSPDPRNSATRSTSLLFIKFILR